MSKASSCIQDDSRGIAIGRSIALGPVTFLSNPHTTVKNVVSEPARTSDTYSHTSITQSINFLMELMELREEQLKSQLFGVSHITYTTFKTFEQQEVVQKQYLWVDMPPLSIEKVVMQARDMGYGEPLAILDILLDN